MPIKASAKKAQRQSIRRAAENNLKRGAYKDAIKKFKKLVDGKDAVKAKEGMTAIYQSLDKAARTNVIKHGKAARLKSRMMKKLASLQKTA